MTIALPADIEEVLGAKAAERHISVEELVCDALRWYLRVESGLADELTAWQEVRDEALDRERRRAVAEHRERAGKGAVVEVAAADRSPMRRSAP